MGRTSPFGRPSSSASVPSASTSNGRPPKHVDEVGRSVDGEAQPDAEAGAEAEVEAETEGEADGEYGDADESLPQRVSRLEKELEATREERETYANQYRTLLSRIQTMKTTLGNKLKQDAVSLLSPLSFLS
jgi:hypothetical protein